MEQINKIIKWHELPLSFLLSSFVYLSLLFIIQYNIGYITLKPAYADLHTPITDLHIPIYYWLAIFIFTFIYSAINKIRFLEFFPDILLLGLFLHVYIMLLQLNQFLLFKDYYSRIYLYYAFAIETGLFIVNIYFLFKILWSNKLFLNKENSSIEDIKKKIYFGFPLVVNIFYHLYRDIKFINISYLCLHLFILLFVYILYKRNFHSYELNKEKIINFITNEKTIILFIFLFSFFIRSFFAFHILHITGDKFPTASDDGPTYNEYAILIMQNISNLFYGKKIIPSSYDPGYSIFLGFVYKIFSHSFYAATLIQSLLGGLMIVVIYLIVKEIFNRKIGVIAAILTAINQPLIMLSVVLTTEATYIPLLVFSIYCLLIFSKTTNTKKRNYYLLAGGIIMGFAIITRAMLLLFPGLVICWLLLHERGLKWLKSGIIFLGGLIIVLFMITTLTYTNTSELRLFTIKQDINWIVFTSKEGSRYTDPRHIYSNAKLIEMGINPFKDMKGSLLIVLKNPIKFLKIESEILPIRLRQFLFYPNFGFFDPLYILTPTTPNQYASTLEFYAILILIIGIINILIKKDTIYKSSLIILLIIYYLIIHVGLTTGQCGRYRVPINPFFMIIGANGLYMLYKYVILSSQVLFKNER